MSKQLRGIGVGTGISVAKALLLKEPLFNPSEASGCTPGEEEKNYSNVLTEVSRQIEDLIGIATKNISAEKGEIFQAHLEIVKDEQIQSEVRELIGEGKSTAWAIEQVFDKYASMFEGMEDDYFRERASDIRDLKKRFLSVALNVPMPDLLLINEDCIIVAHDLSPSETALLNRNHVKGFVTDIGGATSHSAIMARTLEIPAIVSLKDVTGQIKGGELIAINAKNGLVEFNLTPDDEKSWDEKIKKYEVEKAEIEKYKKLDCKTRDGVSISIKGNIGHPKDLAKVLENGGKGVGLFRSEFLYMDSQDWPTEEEQFNAYREVLSNTEYEIVIRTLDIGGDKHLSYYKFPEEMNPFLGYRAIRLSLDKRDIFITQLRALLRASAYGKLKIMFPMIATYEEFMEAKKITMDVDSQLRKEGHKVSDNYEIGMMVEIPSSAVLSVIFAKESQFFSVGSNDLIQYTHAVDRMSKEVNYLYQPNNPSILNLIRMTVEGASTSGRDVSVCGEMASDPISAILLVGIGVRSLSMSANAIPLIKRTLSQLSEDECGELASSAMGMRTEAEVLDYVKNYLRQKNISI